MAKPHLTNGRIICPVVIALVVIVFVFYALSFGPVYAVVLKYDLPVEITNTVYGPLIWLAYRSEFVAGLLVAYTDWWEELFQVW